MTIVSLMFCTYNRLDLTKRMMVSLLRTTTVPFRLIIIDNGSSDETPDWLSMGIHSLLNETVLCQSYDYRRNSQNLGIASGRNQALQIADQYKDPWLCTLDNDVEMPMGWLGECVEIMGAIPRFMIGVNMEGVSYPLITQNGKTFQYKAAGNLGTACMVFGRELFEKIGYFTTDYQFYAHEDANYGFRARLTGHRLGYIKENGIHLGSDELDKGAYREFKNKWGDENRPKFFQDCYDYSGGRKSIYIPFSIQKTPQDQPINTNNL
jgi:GT2 family glycosyltransferase